jgi:dephospho-CoA kinase
MNKKTFIPTEPVYVGFVGPAGSGKTFTAKSIVPPSTAALYGNPSMYPDIIWDHQWMSLPLYSVYNIRTTTIGSDAINRILYGLHDIVNSVTMKQLYFDDMIELIYDLYYLPITNAEDEKPRSFLQQAGDLFLKNNQLCLAKYAKYKIYSMWQSVCVEYDRNELELPWYIGIVSDVRQLHEAKLIHEQKNSLLIKFEADRETLEQRLLDRDGMTLSKEQSVHRTEQEFDSIPNEWYDLVLDTTSISKEEQVAIVKEFILSHNYQGINI